MSPHRQAVEARQGCQGGQHALPPHRQAGELYFEVQGVTEGRSLDKAFRSVGIQGKSQGRVASHRDLASPHGRSHGGAIRAATR